MHNLEVSAIVIGLMALSGGTALLAARYLLMPPWLEREGDEAYVEGWDDALADRLRADADTTILRLGPPEAPMWADGGPVTDDDWRQMNQMVPLPPRPHDFLHPDWEQLAPARITDVPGVAPTVPAVQNHAGDHHHDDYDRPLPTFLHLGAEYTGDDKWRARMTWRGWDQVARHEAARARLAAECGIRFVPMDELEAAA